MAIKELKRNGYPLSKVIGFVWASAEADVEAAGGWSVAEGYHTIQFAGVGDDYPVRNDIVEMYKADGKQPPKDMQETVDFIPWPVHCGPSRRGYSQRCRCDGRSTAHG